MGLSFGVVTATGRSTCRMCLKKIVKDDAEVQAHGYRTQGSIHLVCAMEACIKNVQKEKKRLNEMIP